jgi:NAD(P)-dependent dehydrogenase (short-subunit alcohol dehydrogenase family)
LTTLSQLMDMRGTRTMITGGLGHLGKVIAETLAELGSDLVLVDMPGAKSQDFCSRLTSTWEVNVIYLACDLENERDRDVMVTRLKSDGLGLTCLVNNAAFAGDSDLEGWVVPFEEQTVQTWRRALEVNLTAAFHLSQSLAPELRSSGKGSIINIASIYGEFGPDWSLYEGTAMGNPAAYAASKGGLLQLTRWLSTTLAPDIRVNAISPGGIYRNQHEKFIRRYVKKTPMRRMANEDDFRGAVAYLATSMSNYVTGHTLRVDGGWNV